MGVSLRFSLMPFGSSSIMYLVGSGLALGSILRFGRRVR